MSGKKVLICDDSMLIRVQLKNFLNNHIEGVTILEAANGRVAIDIYKKEKPNLVLMDIVMPETDGLQCLKEIIEMDKDAKVIVLSSVGNKEILKETLKIGAINFIQKPWEETPLSKTIQPYI